jgi:hypothetical protein
VLGSLKITQTEVPPMKNYAKIAEVCHEANRAYCQSINDDSQPSWDDAPDCQRESAIKGVMFKQAKPDSTPADSHDSWLMEKQNQGWVYGETKDPIGKRHPCMVSYDELPTAQRAKDYIFQAIAGTLLKQGDDEDNYQHPIGSHDSVQHS